MGMGLQRSSGMLAPMPGSVGVADVVIGLLTENSPRMLVQAIRLVRSIRWKDVTAIDRWQEMKGRRP